MTTPLTPLVRRLTRWAAAVLMTAVAVGAQAVESVRLADTIRSSGAGTINLLLGTGNVPLSVAQVELLRLEHQDATQGTVRHFLSLGVDVNENAKGMENSAAMGLTVAEARLTVVRPGGTTVYSEFRTRTQALLAQAGSTTRQWRHTLLGEAGSSRLTAANAVQSAFDSTLDIFVPDSLADATSITLTVRLMDVNKTIGDPESFYDYSGGYEDLALLNRNDSKYLNTTLAQSAGFRTLAPAVEPVQGIVSNDADDTVPNGATPVSWAYYPSANGWYQAAYEDNYPQRGDYDFNDLVVAYRYKVGLDGLGRVIRIEAESYLVADGAWYTLDWNFRLPVAGTGQVICERQLPNAQTAEACTGSLQGGLLDVQAFGNIDNSGRFFSGTPDWAANAVKQAERKDGARVSVSVRLQTAIDLDGVGAAAPWLYVRDTGQTIDFAKRDANGFPYAMLLPKGWQNPLENVDLGDAYPQFRRFVETAGASNPAWYLNAVDTAVFDNPSSLWGP